MDEQNQPQQVQAPQPQGGDMSWAEITGQQPAPKKGRNLRRSLLMIPVIAVLIAGLWYGIGWYKQYSKKHSFESRISNDSSVGNIPEAKAASSDTPLGRMVAGSGRAEGVSVGVNYAFADPTTTGDAPSAGTHYVEVGVSVRNDGKDQAIVPGTFYYRTGSGKLLPTATSIGKSSDYPGKDVQVTGKEPLEDLALGPRQSDGSHYLIYQVPKGDTGGKLVWYEGYYDTGSTKLAVFDLD